MVSASQIDMVPVRGRLRARTFISLLGFSAEEFVGEAMLFVNREMLLSDDNVDDTFADKEDEVLPTDQYSPALGLTHAS